MEQQLLAPTLDRLLTTESHVGSSMCLEWFDATLFAKRVYANMMGKSTLSMCRE